VLNWFRRFRKPAGSSSGIPQLDGHADIHVSDLVDASGASLVRGRDLREAGLFEEALVEFDLALSTAQDPGVVHLEIARTHLALRDLTAALDSLQVAVTLNPGKGETWMQLGHVLSRLDRDEEAVEAFREALAESPPEAMLEAQMQLANCLHACGRRDQALEVVLHALSTAAGQADWRLHALAANLYILEERDELALQAYRQALEACPVPTPELLLQFGAAQQHVGQWAEAQATFESILAHQSAHPMARWYLCQCDLVQGHWARGWQGYGARFAAGASPYRPMPFPVWDGQASPDTTLLVLADQGLGDEIMFASCLPDAISRVGLCIVECDPRLVGLFRRAFPLATVVGSHREARAEWLQGLPEPDVQIFAGDLPVLFRRTEESFGGGAGFLQADPVRVEAWRQRLRADWGGKVVLGISWRGGTPGTRTKSRSMGVEAWQPILDGAPCVFISLQYGDSAPELAELNARYRNVVHEYPEALADYEETAALVAALDGVVTVCTAIVHLAGALGRPVWVLVPFAPGFRYTLNRSTLPWYASSRMFRQPVSRDWLTPSTQVAEEVRRLTKNVTS
jgi:tetratricopeptide (TPR) repeat protein